MTTYEARIKLTYCEEFAEEYIKLTTAQADAAAEAVQEKYGEGAKEIQANKAEYVEYALKKFVIEKLF